MNRHARRAAAASGMGIDHLSLLPRKSGTVRIQAASRTLPSGFQLDVPADVCLDFARRLIDELSLQEPVTTMTLSAGAHEWRWTVAS